jgi:hypothetical protein
MGSSAGFSRAAPGDRIHPTPEEAFMKPGAIVPIILSASVVALLALQVATSSRLAKMQDQLAKLEERPAAGASAPPETAAVPAGADHAGTTGTASVAGPASGSDSPAGTATPAGTAGEGASTRKSSRHSGEAMSEKDVEALIEKKLAARDKKNPLASLLNLEDPMTVM